MNNAFNKNQGFFEPRLSCSLSAASQLKSYKKSVNFATIIHLLFYDIQFIWSRVLPNSRVFLSNPFVSST